MELCVHAAMVLIIQNYVKTVADVRRKSGSVNLPGRAPLSQSNTSGCRRNCMPYDIMKLSELRRQISSLTLQLEDTPIDKSIRVIVIELRVFSLQGRFLTIADKLLAPDLPQPIRAPKARRSVTSLPSGNSLAQKISRPIRASAFLGKEQPTSRSNSLLPHGPE